MLDQTIEMVLPINHLNERTRHAIRIVPENCKPTAVYTRDNIKISIAINIYKSRS